MSDRDTVKEKLDKVCLEVAVLAAQQTEMTKRLTEQAASIMILNEAHLQTQVSLTKIEAGQDTNKARIDTLDESIKNSLKNWAVAIGLFITIMTFIINYLLN